MSSAPLYIARMKLEALHSNRFVKQNRPVTTCFLYTLPWTKYPILIGNIRPYPTARQLTGLNWQ
jgi:hypothetical protein